MYNGICHVIPSLRKAGSKNLPNASKIFARRLKHRTMDNFQSIFLHFSWKMQHCGSSFLCKILEYHAKRSSLVIFRNLRKRLKASYGIVRAFKLSRSICSYEIYLSNQRVDLTFWVLCNDFI